VGIARVQAGCDYVRKQLNQSVQPTGGSRFAQPVFERQRRLPPVADACRSALSTEDAWDQLS
jgi:hypothetical protein